MDLKLLKLIRSHSERILAREIETTQTLQAVHGLHRRVKALEEIVTKLAERVLELEDE
jgi:hypothetical protein